MEPMSINRHTAHPIIDAAHARAGELGLRAQEGLDALGG
jgi:hypothetical protein